MAIDDFNNVNIYSTHEVATLKNPHTGECDRWVSSDLAVFNPDDFYKFRKNSIEQNNDPITRDTMLARDNVTITGEDDVSYVEADKLTTALPLNSLGHLLYGREEKQYTDGTGAARLFYDRSMKKWRCYINMAAVSTYHDYCILRDAVLKEIHKREHSAQWLDWVKREGGTFDILKKVSPSNIRHNC